MSLETEKAKLGKDLKVAEADIKAAADYVETHAESAASKVEAEIKRVYKWFVLELKGKKVAPAPAPAPLPAPAPTPAPPVVPVANTTVQE